MRRKKRSRGAAALSVEQLLDDVVGKLLNHSPPAVLYHYTSWSGAEGILKSNVFWATAYDCTNDSAELVSADQIILDVVHDLESQAGEVVGEALRAFQKGWSTLKVSEAVDVYLTCFSAVRDDPHQWCKYAEGGAGVCLGVRVLNETGPKIAWGASGIVEVDYSEDGWRHQVRSLFEKVCSIAERHASTQGHLALAVSALYRIAAFLSISAKQSQWAPEHEFRHVTIVTEPSKVKPSEREGAIRYLPIEVRADGKRIHLAEVIVGPNQDGSVGQARVEKALADSGYTVDLPEYPQLSLSSAAPCPTVPALDSDVTETASL